MDFRDRHIVVTGGAGALGTAVVTALIEAGAICHVPCFNEAEAQRFACATTSRSKQPSPATWRTRPTSPYCIKGISPLWASIHIAGGFAAGALTDTTAATMHQQIDMNLISCMLCSRAAVAAMKGGGGGRIVNVSARAGAWNGAAALG